MRMISSSGGSASSPARWNTAAVRAVMASATSPALASRTPGPESRSGMPTSTMRPPAARSARSYMLRWLRSTMNSSGRPVLSGRRFIAAGSSRAMQAAAPSISAAAAPEVTMPACAPVASAMARQAAAWRSCISTQARAACAMAATTSASIMPPESRVLVP